MNFARSRSTVSIERAILRLFGVAGANDAGVPYVNHIVDRLEASGLLEDGVLFHVGHLAVKNGHTLENTLQSLVSGHLSFEPIVRGGSGAIYQLTSDTCIRKWEATKSKLDERWERRQAHKRRVDGLAYVSTATGDVYGDIDHAEAVAQHGGDIVAVIRSTAQSLLDYVPYGPTREGYGGTFATQEHFRIMRIALDEWSEKNERYVALSSFSSGLCMPEIAAMGALEGLDNMVNDALYGILYRDVNMERTFVDQAFARGIDGATGIVINTGEDNYLRTADALEAAPSVIASQMVNYEMARRCGLPPEQIGIGNAFEISPEIENALLLEWAQALLTRELFPLCPIKYMPPTRVMNGNIFRTHACNTLFNLVSVATRQGIQTIGIPTEGLYTPHIQDRVLALECVRYVKTTAKSLYDEIEFVEGGLVKSHAGEVLKGAADMLVSISEGKDGLFGAIERGMFGDIRRSRTAGKGRKGVFERSSRYLNHFESIFGLSEVAR